MVFGNRGKRLDPWGGTRRTASKARLRLTVETLEDRMVPAGIDPAVLAHAHLDNQILVRFTPGANAGDLVTITHPDTTLGTEILDNLYIIQLDAGVSVAEALTAYQANPFVVYAEPDYVIQPAVIPNDPMFNQLYGLHNTGQSGGTADCDINGPEAWDIQTGAPSIIVAVIDTGVDYNHEDLAANIWTNTRETPGNGVDDDRNGFIDDVHGFDFFSRDGDPMDGGSHGTHCAGTIGAVGNNGIGVAGVNWNVQIMAIRFLGPAGGSTSGAVQSIDYARQMGAHLTSNSWGGGGFSQALLDAILASGQADMAFIAAAGNAGSNNDLVPFYPANYNAPNLISVAATDRNDQLAGFSNFGRTTVDIAAPGVAIVSTVPGNGYASFSGTSMATPHVAGAYAFVKAAYPTETHLQIIQRLYDNAERLSNLSGIVATGARLDLDGIVVPPPPPPTGGTVEGLAWRDQDRDGRESAGEVGEANVRVELIDASGSITGSMLTTSTGLYQFTDVVAGTYRLRFTLSFGLGFTQMDVGDDLGDSDVIPLTSFTFPFDVRDGFATTDMDAGIVPATGGPGGPIITPIPLPPPGSPPPPGGPPGPPVTPSSDGGSSSSFLAPGLPDGGGGGTRSFSSPAPTVPIDSFAAVPVARLDSSNGDQTDTFFADFGIELGGLL